MAQESRVSPVESRRITIVEVGTSRQLARARDRQDVTISETALQEPSDDEDMLSLQTQLAHWPLILVGADNHAPIKDSGAEDLTYYVMKEQHQR